MSVLVRVMTSSVATDAPLAEASSSLTEMAPGVAPTAFRICSSVSASPLGRKALSAVSASVTTRPFTLLM